MTTHEVMLPLFSQPAGERRRYPCIMADPPWAYDKTPHKVGDGSKGAIRRSFHVLVNCVCGGVLESCPALHPAPAGRERAAVTVREVAGVSR